MAQQPSVAEEWRLVPDWPEYSVSSFGHIRRNDTGRMRSAILMKSTGYLVITLTRIGRRQMLAIHRLVALAFLGEPPEPGMQVNHKDSNRANARLDNLEWVTVSENILHGYRSGRCNATGEANGYSKLTNAAVIEIRSLARSDRQNFEDLADRFNVSKATIYDVAAHRTWKHVRAA
ncbi:NUMOD4 motif-containing HNH endonuclease [Gemmobacter sp. 24YEA27]|uniref:NUMOD4 motif-containing HNH endonuclease n=1 Tax=Gemmobacter sp. 24YEA27 TaxID=3040672 RepID=UPI0024B339E6|nr:NUMOD4 motif-containing HNH endonuclease [Gemmobacter sp. 24YEA27]